MSVSGLGFTYSMHNAPFSCFWRSGYLICPLCLTCLRCSELKWGWLTSPLCRNWIAAWLTEVSLPALFRPILSLSFCSFGGLSSLWPFFLIFYSFTVDNKKTSVTDIFPNSTIIVTYDRFYLPKRLCDQQWRQGGHQHWLCALPLNQSGSRWTRVHLSQMLICTAQLWGQRHSTCMWCKITWAGTPSPMLLGFSAHGPGIDVTHRGGQSVPLRLHHDAVPLTAVGSRCSEVTGTGL